MPRDTGKAIELLTRASGELGSIEAMCNFGKLPSIVWNGMRKGLIWNGSYLCEEISKQDISLVLMRVGRAIMSAAKHFAIATQSGDDDGLTVVREGFLGGVVILT